MLENLTHATFQPLVGQQFCIHISPEQSVDVELLEARPFPAAPMRDGKSRTRDPFSLLFRGSKTVRLPQRIYGVEHAAFGRADIFLVPLGPDAAGERYEAVFN